MAVPEDVHLAWVTSFLAVVDNRTFTAAAAATHRSQPRVSAHVAGLERLLGTELFERGRRVRLTEAGSRFLPHARATVAEMQSGIDSIHSLAEDLHGTIAVGSFAGPSGVLLAPLIKRFRADHPAVAVALQEGGPRWLEDAAAASAVDMSVRTADVPTHHDLARQHLMDEHIVLAMPPGHQLAECADLDPEHLSGAALIVTGAPAEGWTDFADRLSACRIVPDSVINVAHPTTVIALVRAGLGIGLLGEMGAALSTFADVTIRPMPTAIWTRGIRAYWNRRRRLSTAAATFLDALITECRHYQPVTGRPQR